MNMAVQDKFSIEDEWADMPSNDGAPVEITISNLRDYDISFFPILAGYYFVHEIGGIHYDIHSSFALKGKHLGNILADIIVEKSVNINKKAMK